MNVDKAVRQDGISAESYMNDLLVVEEKSNLDDFHMEPPESACVPKDLASSSRSIISGSVAISNSDNVHFGDKYIKVYNGPVSIKQILVQSDSGIDNPSYLKTEDERHTNNKKNVSDGVKKFKIQLWHKLTASLLSLVVVGGVSALVLIMQDKEDKESYLSYYDGNLTSEYSKNLCQCYGNNDVRTNILEISSFIFQLETLTRMSRRDKILIAIMTTVVTFIFSILIIKTKQSKHKDLLEKRNKQKLVNASLKEQCTPPNLLIAPNHLRIVSRNDWLAQPVAGEMDKIRQPVPWVIIAHTATEPCFNQSECVYRVRVIQDYHVSSRGWSDIGYNFLVGGDGSVYLGRGWDYQGAHTKGYNKYSIGIAFIGTFNKDNPPKSQVDACKKLINLGVETGKLAKDYKLFVHRQLMSTLSPGDKIYEIVKNWPHFVTYYTLDLIPKY